MAFDRDTNKIKAIGEEASDVREEHRATLLRYVHYVRNVISDYTVTEKMIKYFIQKQWVEKLS